MSKLRKFIAIVFILVGFIVMLLGGLVITVYSIWDIVSNFSTISLLGIFTDIFMIFVKDIIAFVVGTVFILIGFLFLSPEERNSFQKGLKK